MNAAADHARRMDRVYSAQRHIYDLTRKYYLLGRDGLIRDLAPPIGGTVLEVGCGTARNLIHAARAAPDARFFGFDISEAMLDTAHARGSATGVSTRILLTRGDATNFDAAERFGVERFDRVFMSYTLSMIPDWRGAIAHAASLIGANGELHIVDFGQQERLPALWRTALFAWLDHFDVTPRSDLAEVLNSVAVRQELKLDFRRLYRGYAWRALLRRS